MSIRTKLLAAIVGLNGILLILALFLFVQSSAAGAVPYEARAALVRLSIVDEPSRDGVLQTLRQQVSAGYWSWVYVVQEGGNVDREKHERAVYPFDAFLDRERGSHEIQGELRDLCLSMHSATVRNQGVFTDARGLMAVRTTLRVADRAVSIVAMPRDGQGGARALYLAMIAGVVLLTAISFWLVSRLVIHPLNKLADGAARIADGEYTVQLESPGTNDEIDRTVRAFNRMAREVAEYQGQLEDRVLSALERIKKAEKHLAIAQRLAATGKLAAGVAHEINNPLGGMKNAARALQRGDLSDDQTALYLELIDDGLARVERTVKRFLAFTPRRLDAQQADLAVVARSAMGLAEHRAATRGVTLEADIAAGEGGVYGDAHELQQVVLNLLLNAVDACPEGGGGRVRLSLAAHGDEVRLRVEDNGTGMSPEDQDQCFDMFFTTKPVGEGTGLGLAVVHTIVTNHGGRIDVSSVLGEGTTFEVALPGFAPDEAPVAVATPAE